MNPNILQPLPVLGNDEIHEILVKRIDQQKQAVGIVAGVIEPAGRRVVAYGKLANGDPRAISKVFTSLALADMVSRKEVSATLVPNSNIQTWGRDSSATSSRAARERIMRA